MATERREGTHDDISEVPTTAVTRQAEGDGAPLLPVQICFPAPNTVGAEASLCAGEAGGATLRPQTLNEGWFKSHLTEADAKVMEHSGKMVLLFQILEMAEELGDKVYAALFIRCFAREN